jgi:hypothetical protein
MHHITLQHNKTSCQKQKKPQKIFKDMDNEQHTDEKPMSDQSNREEIKKLIASNENENITYQNLWDTGRAMLRGKFITISAYI